MLAAAKSKARRSPESSRITNLFALRLLFIGPNHAPAHDGSTHRLGAVFQLDARALHLIEEQRERYLPVDFEREFAQLLAERLARIVAQAGDLSRRRDR